MAPNPNGNVDATIKNTHPVLESSSVPAITAETLDPNVHAQDRVSGDTDSVLNNAVPSSLLENESSVVSAGESTLVAPKTDSVVDMVKSLVNDLVKDVMSRSEKRMGKKPAKKASAKPDLGPVANIPDEPIDIFKSLTQDDAFASLIIYFIRNFVAKKDVDTPAEHLLSLLIDPESVRK